MSIGLPDVKLLWGRAGGHCSLCKVKLSEDARDKAFHFGEQAHIVAEEPDGPRGASPLTPSDRNKYNNLILLCPTCHTKIDTDTLAYPVEVLHFIKTQHELEIESRRGIATDPKKEAVDRVYAYLVDAAVEKCMFGMWERWTQFALEQPPQWQFQWIEKVEEFRRIILKASWPGVLPELERSLQCLALRSDLALKTFHRHVDRAQGEWLIGDRFYRRYRGVEYDEMRARYNRWLEDCAITIFDATKAANWVAEVVRQDLQPMFFAVEGKFAVTSGPHGNAMQNITRVPEYSDEEKAAEPQRAYAAIEAFRKARAAEERELFGED